jgi:hypothetical protein
VIGALNHGETSMIEKIVPKSNGEQVRSGLWAIDPSGHLVLVQSPVLKAGWRWATPADIKAKEDDEAKRKAKEAEEVKAAAKAKAAKES